MRSTTRVRWDRLGRMAMLCVLGALLYLYVSAGISLLSTWKEARGDSAQVAALERQHAALEAQHALLTSPGTLVRGGPPPRHGAPRRADLRDHRPALATEAACR